MQKKSPIWTIDHYVKKYTRMPFALDVARKWRGEENFAVKENLQWR
ncbi:MAG: hypothetical protein ACLR78_10450 [Roseburia sp.]